MIGKVVTSQPHGTGCVTAFFAAPAVFAGVLAFFTPSVHWAIFGLLPLTVLITSLVLRDPVVQFEVREEGISFELPEPVFVPYYDIQGLTTQGSTASPTFAMQLYHSQGVVRIPAQLDVLSGDLYEFLVDQLASPEAGDEVRVPAPLRGFVQDQVERFGREKVFVFTARPHPPVSTYGWHVAYSWAVVVAGLLWIAAGAILGQALDKKQGGGEMGAWIVGGALLLILGIVCVIGFARSSGSGRVRDWWNSCLIISPGGVALQQGALKGKLRWEELRAIEYPAKPRFGLSNASGVKNGVGLMVDGAYFVIADYYGHPVGLIYQCLKEYWGGRHAN